MEYQEASVERETKDQKDQQGQQDQQVLTDPEAQPDYLEQLANQESEVNLDPLEWPGLQVKMATLAQLVMLEILDPVVLKENEEWVELQEHQD